MATHPSSTPLAILIVLFPFLTVSATAQNDLLINTTHGKVQGKLIPVLGGQVRAFLGIPYGKPPVGKLRYKAPEPVEGWEGVRDATALPNSCHQIKDTTYPGFEGLEMWNVNTPVSEDCLYLNVWTPYTNKSQPSKPPLAPVLVWIYGGGFTSGTITLDLYDGRILSKSEGVVVVSMNYRIGVLGFLSLPDNNDIQGNAGLLDQQLALKWVANNIAAFGGDPSMVTVFGESAGSASVGFHLLSPGSSSLFQRAVMQSGSPHAIWSIYSQSETWSRATRLATLLGCPTSSPAKLEECLQSVDAEKITQEQFNIFTEPALLNIPFSPVVDGNFLPDEPDVLLRTGKFSKKELMIGITRDEGSYFVCPGVPGINFTGESLITRDNFLAGVNLTLASASPTAREAAIFHYTDWTDVNNGMKNRDFIASLAGDHFFACPVKEFAYWNTHHGGKTFFYFFDHRSSVNPWPEWMGVMHGYEIEFVFGQPLNASLGYTNAEVNMTKKIMKHWGNFARTGDPKIDGATWPAFTTERQHYILMNVNPAQERIMLKARECQLWTELIPNLQRASDDLQACLNSSGISLCNNLLLFLLMAALLLY